MSVTVLLGTVCKIILLSFRFSVLSAITSVQQILKLYAKGLFLLFLSLVFKHMQVSLFPNSRDEAGNN